MEESLENMIFSSSGSSSLSTESPKMLNLTEKQAEQTTNTNDDAETTIASPIEMRKIITPTTEQSVLISETELGQGGINQVIDENFDFKGLSYLIFIFIML